MSQAVQEDQWNHTSAILSLLYNSNRGEKSPAMSQNDFHPFRMKDRAPAPEKRKESIANFRQVFFPNDGPAPDFKGEAARAKGGQPCSIST
jgi:hypothetical protein